VTVRDDGIGLEAEAIGRIFRMFEQSNTVNGQFSSGLGIGLSLSRRLTPDWRVFGFTRYDNYTQAANRDSPLFRQNSGLSVGVGFTWTAYRSTARAWE